MKRHLHIVQAVLLSILVCVMAKPVWAVSVSSDELLRSAPVGSGQAGGEAGSPAGRGVPDGVHPTWRGTEGWD